MNEHLEHARKWLGLPDVSLDELVAAARAICAEDLHAITFRPVRLVKVPAASAMTFSDEGGQHLAVSTAALRDVILSRRKEDTMAQPDCEVTPRPDYIPALGVLRAMLDGLPSIADVLLVYDEVAVQSGRLNDISYLTGAYRSVHALRIDSDVGPAYHGELADVLVDLTEKGYYAPYKGRFRVNKALADKYTTMRWDAQLGDWRAGRVERVALGQAPAERRWVQELLCEPPAPQPPAPQAPSLDEVVRQLESAVSRSPEPTLHILSATFDALKQHSVLLVFGRNDDLHNMGYSGIVAREREHRHKSSLPDARTIACYDVARMAGSRYDVIIDLARAEDWARYPGSFEEARSRRLKPGGAVLRWEQLTNTTWAWRRCPHADFHATETSKQRGLQPLLEQVKNDVSKFIKYATKACDVEVPDWKADAINAAAAGSLTPLPDEVGLPPTESRLEVHGVRYEWSVADDMLGSITTVHELRPWASTRDGATTADEPKPSEADRLAEFFATSEHDCYKRETEPDWRQLRDLLPDSKYLRVGLLGWEFSCIQLDGVVWCGVTTDAGNRTAPMKATDLCANVPVFDCPAAWWAERVSDAQRAQRLIDAAIPTLPRVPRKP